MKFKLLLILSLIISVSLYSAENNSKMTGFTKSKLQLAKEYKKANNSLQNIQSLQYPYMLINSRLYVNLLIEINDNSAIESLKSQGCKIITSIKNIVAISAPADKVEDIMNLASVKTIETSKMYKNNLDQSKAAISAENVMATDDYTDTGIIGGEGVIVGIVDTGIDWTHPDFNNDGDTRILKMWDMYEDDASEAPVGYDFGREYTKEIIDHSPLLVSEFDSEGHGTHVAGTAAGSGNANPAFKGIAYNSDLMIVKGTRSSNPDGFSDMDILSGCDYLIKQAKSLNKPIVINLSLGSSIGPHDGSALLAQGLSGLSGKGAIIVVAAGNDGELPMHAGGNVTASETIEFPISPINICEKFEDFCPDIEGFYLTAADVWFRKDVVDSVYVIAYQIGLAGFQEKARLGIAVGDAIESQPMFTSDNAISGLISFSSTSEYYSNGDGNMMVQIHNGGDPSIEVGSYYWSLIYNIKKTGSIDIWAGIPFPEGTPYISPGGRNMLGNSLMTIGSPGDGDSVICVGAFVTKNQWTDMDNVLQDKTADWTIGSIASFSSKGPTRYGRILPLISAPGRLIFAPKSKDYITQNKYMLDEYYVGMNGTSMATPHVTGAIALMLQINPELSYSDIVDIFNHSAKKDEFTTNEVPNNYYGYGKLNVQSAIDYLLGINGVDYVMAKDTKVYPNPAVGFVNLELNDVANISDIQIYNSNAELVNELIEYTYSINENITTIRLNTNNLSSGIYNLNCNYDNKTAKFRFVVK